MRLMREAIDLTQGVIEIIPAEAWGDVDAMSVVEALYRQSDRADLPPEGAPISLLHLATAARLRTPERLHEKLEMLKAEQSNIDNV